MRSSTEWRNKRVLVTGATGFIGRYLVGRLVELGAHVYAGSSPPNEDRSGAVTEVDADPSPEPGAASTSGRTRQSVVFDVRDAEAVRDTIDGVEPDVVFHLAAVGVTNPNVDPMLALTVNAGGVVNLLEAFVGHQVDRVVLVGTSYEYGASGTTTGFDPLNAYAASKVAAWAFGRMYWRTRQLPVVMVRPFQVYGPGQPGHTLIPAAINAALSGEDFSMTPGEQERDFIFAEDVADGMIAAAGAAGIEGATLDLGTGIGIEVRRVVEQIWQLADGEGDVQPGARPYRTGSAVHLVADADRTARLTGWRATTPLERGLRKTLEQLQSQMGQAI